MSEISGWIQLVFLPAALVAMWYAASANNWVRKSILPSPATVLESFQMLNEKGIFFEDLRSTLMRIIVGFVCGATIGIVMGVLIGIFPTVDRFTKVSIAIFRPIPTIALIPFVILWLGIGENSKITIVTLGTFWALMLNTISGIKNVDPKLIELARMLKKSRFETVRRVILPFALPSVFTGIRLAASSALAMSVTAEMIAAQNGIGYRIMFARNMAQPGVMFIGIVELGLFGMIIDLLLLRLQDWLFRNR
ncbi:MAG: ABC transporter permease [Lachnospiraceae bacterium]|nr:ABC transporter permease [Lachnospiraceae bacterium]